MSKYKLIKNPDTGIVDQVKTSYTEEGLIEVGGVGVTTTITYSSVIPFSEGNTDYQNYLAWVAEGNTPEEAD